MQWPFWGEVCSITTVCSSHFDPFCVAGVRIQKGYIWDIFGPSSKLLVFPVLSPTIFPIL